MRVGNEVESKTHSYNIIMQRTFLPDLGIHSAEIILSYARHAYADLRSLSAKLVMHALAEIKAKV